MWKDTVDIDPLAYSSISLEFQFIPEFCLPHKDKCHGTRGIEAVIQEETKFLNCFLLQQMGFVQDADHFFMLDSPYDLDLVLHPASAVTTANSWRSAA